MARDITTGFETEIEAESLNPCLFIKAEFDSGDINLWSGYGQITFNAETYQGAGQLLAISQIDETQELKANTVNFELSGLPSAIIALALTEDINNRPITCWFGVLDSDGAIIADPYMIFSGRMDTAEINLNGETGKVIVSAESDLIDLRNSRERRYTPEDQKIDYPNDEGFQFVPIIQDITITWGAGRTD